MNVATDNTVVPDANPHAAPSARGVTHRPFEDLLRVSFEKASDAARSPKQTMHDLANQFVSIAFIKPMLAEARKSPFQSDLFHGGLGEQMFQEHLDTVIADRIAKRTNMPLADAVVKHLIKGMKVDQHG